MISRRSFLSTLGIAASGIALRPSLVRTASKWLVPEDVVVYDGPINLEWLLAESVAALAANLDHKQFRYIPELSRLMPDQHHLGIDFRFERADQFSRKDFRATYIEPAMSQLAQAIESRKPRTCLMLELPKSVEYAGRIVNERAGLDLRFIRAWDIGSPADTYTDHNGGEVFEIPARSPNWINRFDILVA